MPPEEDARAILRLALRHEQSLAASLDPAFAQENWGFLAQQCVEKLLKALVVLADEQPRSATIWAACSSWPGWRCRRSCSACRNLRSRRGIRRKTHPCPLRGRRCSP